MQTYAQYRNYLVRLNQSLSPQRTVSRRGTVPKAPVKLPGLDNLLESFGSGSLHDRVLNVEEWNPLGQRPVFEPMPTFGPGLGENFERVGDVAYRLVIAVHEAMHVLLWEPFFTGSFRPLAKDFRSLSLAFEGFCFWYADIVLNSKIDLRFPDGERVLSRCSVSQTSVHPRQALKIMGVEGARPSMELYLATFTGHESEYARRSANPVVRDLAIRFYSFYQKSAAAPRAMHRILSEVGLFDEYFRRFCRREGIPSLLTPEICESVTKAPESYCWDVYTRGMAGIGRLAVDEVRRVRLRRAIQIRAYHVHCLRHILEQGLFLARPGFRAAPARASVDDYADRLDEALERLCRRDPAASVEALVQGADRVYSRGARSRFLIHDVQVASREQIYPALSVHTRISLDGEWTSFSDSKLRKFGASVVDEIAIPSLECQDRAQVRTLARAILLLTEQLEKPGDRARLVRRMRSVIKHPLVFRRWTVSLASIDPLRGSFRELLFKYQ